MTKSPPSFRSDHAIKCELATQVLRSSGRLRLQVTGWSMLPSLWPGDTLIIESTHIGSILEGDIVLFGREGRLFVHRVVRKLQDSGIAMRGDAMRSFDPIVRGDELLGRISLIERDGKSFAPRRRMGITGRALAAFIRSSKIAARVVVGARGSFQFLQLRTS